MKSGKTASIVLAAGYSSRMFSFKPFLKFGEYTAIEKIIGTLKAAEIEDIIVVTGHRGSEVADKLKGSDVTCIWNEDYSKGMYSSVVKGVEALNCDIKAFFVMPVDVPLIKKHTLGIMREERQKTGKGILYPVYCGKRGHPPLIDIKYKQSVLDGSGEGGLERVLSGFSGDSAEVSVFDPTVIMDMDVKEDYEALLDYHSSGAPGRDECTAILDSYNVSEDIISHCTKVAEVSITIVKNLECCGFMLDGAALEAAAMLHDIAKGKKNHAAKGAALIRDIGYEKVGNIISSHTDLEVDENGEITENEILYLADKLVSGDKTISLEGRRELSIKAFGGSNEILDKINKRFDAAVAVVKKFEEIAGKGIIHE